MSLRSQIAPHDCIQEYEQSAREHQDAGLTLLTSGSAQGVALMALSIEMLLKASYFRLLGYAPARPIGANDLKDAQSDFVFLGIVPGPGPSGLHDILFLADGLIAARQSGLPSRTYGPSQAPRLYPAVAAAPMAVADQTELRRCAGRLMTNWSVGDRYRSLARAAKQDLEDVFDDAVGIVGLYDSGKDVIYGCPFTPHQRSERRRIR